MSSKQLHSAKFFYGDPVKIYINGRFLSRTPTGVDRFALELLLAVDNLLSDEPSSFGGLDLVVVTPKHDNRSNPFKSIKLEQTGFGRGIFWEQFSLPTATIGNTLINLCNSAPIFKSQQITVIHDLATLKFPSTFSRKFRLWYRLLLWRLIFFRQKILTVSAFSKNEIESTYKTGNYCDVIFEGSDHMHRIAADHSVLSKHELLDYPYILAVSSLAPHKNFGRLLEVASNLDTLGLKVVIAGGTNPRVFGAQTATSSSNVRYIGYVSDAELKALYESATAFIFPSLYEGFGLPPVEAMACGCPVIASNVASIPEVCNDAAFYFDPNSSKSIECAIMTVTSDTRLQNDLRQKGFRRASELLWKHAAAAFIEQVKRFSTPR